MSRPDPHLTRAFAARQAFINWRLRDLPPLYQDLVPVTFDLSELLEAERAIRWRFIDDVAAAIGMKRSEFLGEVYPIKGKKNPIPRDKRDYGPSGYGLFDTKHVSAADRTALAYEEQGLPDPGGRVDAGDEGAAPNGEGGETSEPAGDHETEKPLTRIVT